MVLSLRMSDEIIFALKPFGALDTVMLPQTWKVLNVLCTVVLGEVLA